MLLQRTNKRELVFTVNEHHNFRQDELNFLRDAATHRGIPTRILSSANMWRETTAPWAAINLIGTINQTHLRFLRQCEIAGTLLLNDVYGARIADDKALSNIEIERLGFPAPKTIDLHTGSRNRWAVQYVRDHLGFPCVLKVPNSGTGQGVVLIQDEEVFEDVYDLLYTMTNRQGDYNTSSNLIAQKFVATSRSRDLRVIVLGGEVKGAFLRQNPNRWNLRRPLDFPEVREGTVPLVFKVFDIPHHIKERCVAICKHLKLGLAGLDLFFTEDPTEFLFGEINTLPGLEAWVLKTHKTDLPGMIIDYLISKEQNANTDTATL